MAQDILIGGVPFIAMGHRDGGFISTAGLFAFARHGAGGAYTVLHLEMAAQISLAAAPHHPRWAWALGQGMDSLLVHMFGRPARLAASVTPQGETVDWHPLAQVDFFGVDLGESADDDGLATTIHVAGSVLRFGGGD